MGLPLPWIQVLIPRAIGWRVLGVQRDIPMIKSTSCQLCLQSLMADSKSSGSSPFEGLAIGHL